MAGIGYNLAWDDARRVFIIKGLLVVDFSRFDNLGVSVIAIPVRAISADAGFHEIAENFTTHHLIPVVGPDRRLVGVMRDIDVLRTGSDRFVYTSENGNGSKAPRTLSRDATVGEVRELLKQGNLPEDTTIIPIVDGDGRYSGYCASRLELLRLLSAAAVAPPKMGGLATPLGVYMTSGYYTGGVGWPGLVATGAVFALAIFVIQWFYMGLFSAMAALWPPLWSLNEFGFIGLELAVTLIAILGLLRLTPLAGYHAAEHMTINAVEKGLPITEENVRIQLREHMRCGTNIMVLLAGIQLAWISLETIRPIVNIYGEIFYILFWVWLVVTYWRRVGFWIQSHFTTRTPTRKQLLSGMKAGQDILDQYREQPHPEPGILRRIWGSGLLQIVASFLLVHQGLIFVVNEALKLL